MQRLFVPIPQHYTQQFWLDVSEITKYKFISRLTSEIEEGYVSNPSWTISDASCEGEVTEGWAERSASPWQPLLISEQTLMHLGRRGDITGRGPNASTHSPKFDSDTIFDVFYYWPTYPWL